MFSTCTSANSDHHPHNSPAKERGWQPTGRAVQGLSAGRVRVVGHRRPIEERARMIAEAHRGLSVCILFTADRKRILLGGKSAVFSPPMSITLT